MIDGDLPFELAIESPELEQLASLDLVSTPYEVYTEDVQSPYLVLNPVPVAQFIPSATIHEAATVQEDPCQFDIASRSIDIADGLGSYSAPVFQDNHETIMYSVRDCRGPQCPCSKLDLPILRPNMPISYDVSGRPCQIFGDVVSVDIGGGSFEVVESAFSDASEDIDEQAQNRTQTTLNRFTNANQPPQRQLSQNQSGAQQFMARSNKRIATARPPIDPDSKFRAKASDEPVDGTTRSSTKNPDVNHYPESSGSTTSAIIVPEASHARWIDEIVPDLILAIVEPSISIQLSEHQIRVLTHALPLPSVAGYCFPQIISKIQSLVASRQTHTISHIQAISGEYNSSEIPSTPPVTPALPQGEDSYFPTNVFDMTVSVPDYQQSQTELQTQGSTSYTTKRVDYLPQNSPRPAVPPASIHVSITERYIPPARSSEFNELFDSSSGRSLLADRLIELSASDGFMIFVYPTKAGALTFLKEYLSPILAPMIRHWMVMWNLGEQQCRDIEGSDVAEDMLSYGEMKARVKAFCQSSSASNTISRHSSGISSSEEVPALLNLVHAEQTRVSLVPQAWSHWWCRQHKSRIIDVLGSQIRQKMARSQPEGHDADESSSSDNSGIHRTAQVLEHVRKVSSETTSHDQSKGVEVGVFIIKKQAWQRNQGGRRASNIGNIA